MRGRWDSRITLEITGLHEISGSDYGIEEPYWKPSAKSTPYLKPWRNLDLPYVKIIKLTKQSWSFHSFRGLTRLGKTKGLTKKKKKFQTWFVAITFKPTAELGHVLESYFATAGWMASHPKHSFQSQRFECYRANCLTVYWLWKEQYPLPAVSRGEQWLHVCNIYTDGS